MLSISAMVCLLDKERLSRLVAFCALRALEIAGLSDAINMYEYGGVFPYCKTSRGTILGIPSTQDVLVGAEADEGIRQKKEIYNVLSEPREDER